MVGRRQLLRVVNSSQEGGDLGTLVYNGCLLRNVQQRPQARPFS